jgi:hypothetical protein
MTEEEEADWYPTLIKWFESTDASTDLYIDKEWIITKKDDENQRMLVSQEELPFQLLVDVGEYFIHISLYTNLETAVKTIEERLKLYRDLLILNDETYMVKFVLSGRNDEIVLRTDLDKCTLGKEEFNDAIVSILFGVEGLRKVLGVHGPPADEQKEKEATIAAIVSALKTKPKKEVVKMLVNAGMPKDTALTMVDDIIKEYKISPFPEKGYL